MAGDQTARVLLEHDNPRFLELIRHLRPTRRRQASRLLAAGGPGLEDLSRALAGTAKPAGRQRRLTGETHLVAGAG